MALQAFIAKTQLSFEERQSRNNGAEALKRFLHNGTALKTAGHSSDPQQCRGQQKASDKGLSLLTEWKLQHHATRVVVPGAEDTSPQTLGRSEIISPCTSANDDVDGEDVEGCFFLRELSLPTASAFHGNVTTGLPASWTPTGLAAQPHLSRSRDLDALNEPQQKRRYTDVPSALPPASSLSFPQYRPVAGLGCSSAPAAAARADDPTRLEQAVEALTERPANRSAESCDHPKRIRVMNRPDEKANGEKSGVFKASRVDSSSTAWGTNKRAESAERRQQKKKAVHVGTSSASPVVGQTARTATPRKSAERSVPLPHDVSSAECFLADRLADEIEMRHNAEAATLQAIETGARRVLHHQALAFYPQLELRYELAAANIFNTRQKQHRKLSASPDSASKLERLRERMELEIESLQVARQELQIEYEQRHYTAMKQYRQEANEVNRKLSTKVKDLMEENESLREALQRLKDS
jgi:hypothetical protein